MKTVLITGASRGIGRAAALRMARAGWHVYAGVRRPEDGEQLRTALGEDADGRIEPLDLDVADDASVAALTAKLPRELSGVVNNAGIAIDGPVESLTSERLREQLEVNLVGHVAVTRTVLPLIRAGRGRIVFVSSVSGRVSTPWMGAYNASKFALEGLADALRMELRPWKIPVSLIEPSNTKTDLWNDAGEVFDRNVEAMTVAERELYAGHMKGVRRSIKLMQKTALPADGVAKQIEKALTSSRPRARYIPGLPAKAQAVGAIVTPRPLLDFVLATATGVPRRA